MSVEITGEGKVFSLHTKSTTYQMMVDQYGYLIHLYYGARTTGIMSYLLDPWDRGGAGQPHGVEDRTYSLDCMPQEFPFAGGCLGCFRCAASGKCIYKDRFDDYLREHIQSAAALVYAYTVKDHSMGYRFKLFDDRQFCNGHRTVTMGIPVAYLINGTLEAEPNLRTLMEARAQVGGNYLAGMADDVSLIPQTAVKLAYAVERNYLPPKDFYGVGGMKIFRDLIFQMQGLMREDHRFYKAHGFYDFPQKRLGRVLGMYAVGAMMNNENFRKKAGNKINEGMVMPYEAVMKKY